MAKLSPKFNSAPKMRSGPFAFAAYMDEFVPLPNLTNPRDRTVFIPSQFKISFLIRFALWSLYVVLMLPLPFLAYHNANLDISELELGIELGIALLTGAILLQMVLSEQVRLDEVGIAVCYPKWVPQWFRQGWALNWADIEDLNARSTGQGGLVYYLVAKDRSGYLLPLRIAGFSRMLRLIQLKTNLDMQDVKPLAQPWMYTLLLGAAGLMAIADGWVIWMVWMGTGQGQLIQ